MIMYKCLDLMPLMYGCSFGWHFVQMGLSSFEHVVLAVFWLPPSPMGDAFVVFLSGLLQSSRIMHLIKQDHAIP